MSRPLSSTLRTLGVYVCECDIRIHESVSQTFGGGDICSHWTGAVEVGALVLNCWEISSRRSYLYKILYVTGCTVVTGVHRRPVNFVPRDTDSVT